MPWLILFGLGAYLLWKERAKLTSASVTVQTPVAQDMSAPPPQDEPAPQEDGGAPAPSGGASGGGGYADPGPSTTPAPAPAVAPVSPPPGPLPFTKTLVDFAKTVTPQSVTFAPRPTVEDVGIRGTRFPHDPEPTPAPTGPAPLGGAGVTSTPLKPSAPISMVDLRTSKKTF